MTVISESIIKLPVYMIKLAVSIVKLVSMIEVSIFIFKLPSS